MRKVNPTWSDQCIFQCIGEGQIIALTPPFGEAIDFHERNATLPIEIELRFSMFTAEREELIRNISAEAPQLRNAVEVLDPSLLLSATISITNQLVRFGYLSRLALVDRRDAQPASVIFAAELSSASELQLSGPRALVLQRFRQHRPGSTTQKARRAQLFVIGLVAHTCVEATVRYAAELGYEVTVIKDATADYSEEMMRAALEINLPNYANAIVSTDEILQSISLAGRPSEEIETV